MSDDDMVRVDPGCQMMGVGRTTAETHVQEGLMTPPVALGRRAKGWPVREIKAVNAARAAGRTDDQIRALVRRLVEERAARAQALMAEAA